MDGDTMMIVTWFLVGVGVVSVCGTMYWCYKLYKYFRDPYFEYIVDEALNSDEPPPEMYSTLKSNILRRMANTLRKATKKKVHKIVKNDQNCTICLEPLNNSEGSIHSSGDSALGLLKCGHIFHFECVWRWLRAHFNCPVCRTQTHMMADDIKAISIKAFEKAVSSSTLPKYYRRKSKDKKVKKAESKESVATSFSGGALSESSSAANSPGRSSEAKSSSTGSPTILFLEGGNIGESDESLQIVSPQQRPKVRPDVRTHKFRKKSEPDLPGLSLTSLASIPEAEIDLTKNNISATAMPSFGHPVLVGKFTPQPEGNKQKQNAQNLTPKQNGHVVQDRSDPVPSTSAGDSGSPGGESQNSTPASAIDKTKYDSKNHLATYRPSTQQLEKMHFHERVTDSSLWNSQLSQASDGVVSMLNLVQEEQQADAMKTAIQDEVRNSIDLQDNPMLLPHNQTDNKMAESADVTVEIPETVRSNWILKT